MAKKGGEYAKVEKKEKSVENNKKSSGEKWKKKRKVTWRKRKEKKERFENERIAVLKEGRRIRRSKNELPLNSTVKWKKKEKDRKRGKRKRNKEIKEEGK